MLIKKEDYPWENYCCIKPHSRMKKTIWEGRNRSLGNFLMKNFNDGPLIIGISLSAVMRPHFTCVKSIVMNLIHLNLDINRPIHIFTAENKVEWISFTEENKERHNWNLCFIKELECTGGFNFDIFRMMEQLSDCIQNNFNVLFICDHSLVDNKPWKTKKTHTGKSFLISFHHKFNPDYADYVIRLSNDRHKSWNASDYKLENFMKVYFEDPKFLMVPFGVALVGIDLQRKFDKFIEDHPSARVSFVYLDDDENYDEIWMREYLGLLANYADHQIELLKKENPDFTDVQVKLECLGTLSFLFHQTKEIFMKAFFPKLDQIQKSHLEGEVH